MKSCYKFEVTRSLIFEWLLTLVLFLLVAIVGFFADNIVFTVFSTVVIIICSLSPICNTFFWLRVAYDIKFSEPQKTVTKGYSNYYNKDLYDFLYRFKSYSARKYICFYSKIRFDDKRLIGWFVYFDQPTFKHGEPIEVVYYPRSKYIKSISRLDRQNDK